MDEVTEPVLRRLSEFRSGTNFRTRLRHALWFVCSHLAFTPWYVPRVIRPVLLRSFGATVGRGVVIREGVYVHAPWNLALGDSVWLGRGVTIVNHAMVTVGHDTCLSQEAFICSSGHDPSQVDFRYLHAPISIGPHCWLAARSVILPGDVVPAATVVASGRRFRDLNRNKQVVRGDSS